MTNDRLMSLGGSYEINKVRTSLFSRIWRRFCRFLGASTTSPSDRQCWTAIENIIVDVSVDGHCRRRKRYRMVAKEGQYVSSSNRLTPAGADAGRITGRIWPNRKTLCRK